MKKTLFAALLSFAFLYAGAQKPSVKHELEGAEAEKASAQIANPPAHPRIIWLKGDEDRVKKAIKSDAVFARIHEAVMKVCETSLKEAPVERVLTGRRLLSISRLALQRITSLAYAWRITDDERYARRAEQEILALCSFTDWNPSHYLDVAEATTAVALGYDWLYDWLPQSTKDKAVKAMVELGINSSLAGDKNTGWLRSDNNWNQVCNAGLSLGALATWESNPELSKKIILRAVGSIRLPMSAYAPDGAYPEGYGYWIYGTSYNVIFISAMEKAFGTDFGLNDMPGFKKTPYYMLNMVGAKYSCFNYSDGGELGMPTPMFWFASRFGDSSLLLAEAGKIAYLGDRVLRERTLPLAIVWGAGFDCSRLDKPKTNMWVGGGEEPVALMRTGWEFNKDIFVGFKGGSPYVNHAHMDVGSFVLDMDGYRWAMDLGAQDYNSLETRGLKIWNRTQGSDRWSVFRLGTYSHNLMIFSDSMQRVAGHADLASWGEKPGFTFATADLTPVNNEVIKSHKRGVAIMDGKYVVVRDEVENIGRVNPVRWQILTRADVKITSATTAELTQGDKTVVMTVKGKGIKMSTWSSQPKTDYDVRNTGTILVGFSATLAPGEKASYEVSFAPKGIKPDGKGIKELNDWK